MTIERVMRDDDERIEALREVASDDCEYSGWVNLAQGALDVIGERDAELERLRGPDTVMREALAAIKGPTDRGPWMTFYREAGGGYEGLQAIASAALAAVNTSEA